MSTELAALLAASTTEPEDDAPRLVLADWLEEHGQPERAELIRVQCEVASRSGGGPHRPELRLREFELLRQHGASWNKAAPASWKVEFQRGLLVVGATAATFSSAEGMTWWEEHGWWVTRLDLWDCSATTLRRLVPRFTCLSGLGLRQHYRAGVTDKGLQALAHLSQLTSLCIDSPDITDTGLEVLAGLTRLRELDLSRTGVTDKGLKVVACMERLTRLQLSWTAITNNGLQLLAGLSQLRHLDLSGTRVSDRGLRHLLALPNLGRLDLDGTRVTDAGLDTLRRLPQLRVLHVGGRHKGVGGVRVSEEAVATLGLALPQCDIHHYR
ncbi:MAG: TIGR02996 domain-containing protein [Gemmataceae bacterium]|nr:TIGR02996 domain-containing protein [Gemmataceae bacterium]